MSEEEREARLKSLVDFLKTLIRYSQEGSVRPFYKEAGWAARGVLDILDGRYRHINGEWTTVVSAEPD